MGVLKNGRHEKFAQGLAKGLGQGEAYAAAGYKPDDGNAAHLTRNHMVETRVAELKDKMAERVIEKTAITEAAVIEELAKIGFANMQDYIRIGSDGDPYTDFSALTRDQAAAIGEVTVEDFKDGRGEDARDVRRVKFKLMDKRGALVDLGKTFGIFKDKVEHSGTVNFTNLADRLRRAKSR